MSQSKLIAKRALKESGNNLSKAIDRCFELLLARHSTGQEKTAVQDIKAEDLFLVCRAILKLQCIYFPGVSHHEQCRTTPAAGATSS